MESLYVLQLENNKWYVGKTSDVAKRFKEHQSGKGSAWTTVNKPLFIVESRPLKDAYDETNTTKELMKKYGIDNVRGGAHVQVSLPDHVEKTLSHEIRDASGKCFNCGLGGHFAGECPITIREPKQKRAAQAAVQVVTCYRCGREGHYSTSCYARTHVRAFNLETYETDEEEDDDDSDDEEDDDDSDDEEDSDCDVEYEDI